MSLKSGKPIYNSEDPDTASGKMRRIKKRRRGRRQAIVKRCVFHANAKNYISLIKQSKKRII